MKSAYELAMERFGPTKSMTDEQKLRIAEIDKRFKAKIAELEIMRQGAIDNAADEPERQAFLRQQLHQEISDLEAKSEREKEAVRSEQA